jgi:octaprenyl-diphosphate synthase
MITSTKTIFKPFQKDLDRFQDFFKRSMTSNVRLVDQVAKYIVKRKGKQLRPMLVLVSTRTLAEPNERTFLASVVVELLHTATLIHDDVVDESEIRRGFPTINKMWKNKISILMGDYLLAKSLIISTEIGSIELMNLIASVAKRMSKGELLQIQKSRKLNIDEHEYFQLISDKTASLLSACCEIGALTTGASLEKRTILKSFGENLGIAFQIKDDLLDYQSRTRVIGKPVGNDLKEKKITLPLLYAFQESEDGERKKILKMLKNGVEKKEVNAIIEFINKYDGINKASRKAMDHKDLAIAELEKLPESPAREVLKKLAEFVVNRKK